MILSELGALSSRYLLAELSDGGVVVDVQSGDYLHLNKSASIICRILLHAASLGDAIEETARSLRIDGPVAEQHLRGVLSALAEPRPPVAPRERLQYVASASGFDLCYDGRAVLHIDDEGRGIEVVAPLSTLPAPVDSFVRQILPRIAFLKGVMIVHGSVVQRGEQTVAITGLSGAGKSTTAGALMEAGGRGIADDLIMIVPRADHVAVPDGAERTLNAWAAQASRDLVSKSAASTSEFPVQVTGPEGRLTEIWFVDRNRRHAESTIRKQVLPPSEVLIRALANSFVGSAEWSRHLRATHHLASTTAGYELTVPDTIAALQAAARAQTTNVASYFSGAARSDDSQA